MLVQIADKTSLIRVCFPMVFKNCEHIPTANIYNQYITRTEKSKTLLLLQQFFAHKIQCEN